MDLKLLEEMASTCSLCELHKGRVNPVFSKGNPNSNIMICGMVPADEENKIGLPFVGRAGKLLDTIISTAGLSLNDVYITNLVKCYLSAGLLLQQDWIDACLPYIITQISIIRPKVIITLGKDSSYSLLGLSNKVSIGSIRGKVFDYSEHIKIIPTYHPSYLLRGGGEKHRDYKKTTEDFLLSVTTGKGGENGKDC